jgi:uncharacterized protein
VKWLIDRVTEEGSEQTFVGDSAWRETHLRLDAAPGEPRIGDLAVATAARTLASNLYLEGSVGVETELTCSRCLARYGAPIREQFRLVLEPAGDRIPADPEGAAALEADGLCLSDELETGWFRGPEIHLDRYVSEIVVLALPVQPVCREECRGLCPRCGVDQNQETCDCSEERPRSPFAALAKLRGTRGDNEGETR